MTELFKYVMKEEQTFNKFKLYLYEKVGQNNEKFRKFSSYPDAFKLPIFIQFLEKEGVPIVDAICFYNITYPGTPSSFQDVLIYMVCCEFTRIENNKTTNYVPF